MEGCLWGPALVLARAAGDRAYADTVAAMASATAGPGSPLASLLLMLSGGHDLLLPIKPVASSSPSKLGSGFNLKGLLNKSASKVRCLCWVLSTGTVDAPRASVLSWNKLRILSCVLDVHQDVLAHAQSPHKSCMWCDQLHAMIVLITVQGINSMLKGSFAM